MDGNYFLLKPSEKQIAKANARRMDATKPGNARIVLSLLGLALGIFLSFIVTGIHTAPPAPAKTPPQETVAGQKTPATVTPSKPQVQWPALADFWKIGLITFVICMLSYQGLYFSLKLFVNEPPWLILFVAFQYGFFWQSVVKGGAAMLSGTSPSQ
jgi:hypothetical protein